MDFCSHHENLDCGSLDSCSFHSGSLQSCSLHSGSLNSCNLHSGSLKSGSIQSGSIQSGSIQSGSILSGSLKSGSIQPGSIKSGFSLLSGNLQTCQKASDTHRSGNLQFCKLHSGSIHSGNIQSCKLHSDNMHLGDSQSNYGSMHHPTSQHSTSMLPPASHHSTSMVHPASQHSTSMMSSNYSELILSQHDLALQAFCKQNLKSRIFRGFYIERRYVDIVQGYRDIVALETNEQELQKILLDIHSRVVQFYMQQTKSIRWFGLSLGKLKGAPKQAGSMEAYIWTELKDTAYGQYWFSIKTVRFREDEVLLKLKVLRLVENKGREAILRPRIKQKDKSSECLPTISSETQTGADNANETAAFIPPEPKITVKEFVEVLQTWGNNIKHSIYNFMSNDVTKENIVALFRFLGLLFISLASGLVYFTKNLGSFSIHFMYEMSRLTHVLTPIVMRLIDVLSKTIGGFYILLTMVWRDTMTYIANRRNLNIKQASQAYKSIDCTRNASPIIQKPRRQERIFGGNPNARHYGVFERKFPM